MTGAPGHGTLAKLPYRAEQIFRNAIADRDLLLFKLELELAALHDDISQPSTKKHPKKAKRSDADVDIEAAVLEPVTEGDDQIMVGERDVDNIRLDWVRAQVRKVDVRAGSRRPDEGIWDDVGNGRGSNCKALVS